MKPNAIGYFYDIGLLNIKIVTSKDLNKNPKNEYENND